ncbi:MAG: phage tail protein [Chloroflexota bacterium]
MAVQEQTFFLLDPITGWQPAALQAVAPDVESGCLRLRPLPGTARPLADEAGSFGGLQLPTGLALDNQDRLYILDGQAGIVKRYDPCIPGFETLDCLGGKGAAPRQLLDPHGIAISRRGDLYIADSGNRRVQVFALKGLALRAIWGPYRVLAAGTGWRLEGAAPVTPPPANTGACAPQADFPDKTWQPWDLVAGPHGRVYVSDYANGLVLVFDRRGVYRAAYSGEPGAPLEHPTHLAIDRDGNLYIVQENKDYITVLDAQGQFIRRVGQPDEVKGLFRPLAVAVDASGNLFLSDQVTHRLYMYCDASQAAPGWCTACTGFEGLGAALVFDSAGNLLLGDSLRQAVAQMAPAAQYSQEGIYLSAPLDSGLYRCQWHRVTLHADLPAGTRLRVETFTAEATKPVEEVLGLPDSRWATDLEDSLVGEQDWDCLVASPPGRYLWLRLRILGDGSGTPSVYSARVEYPRASSSQYLPATYSSSPASAEFLGRFLSIFDYVLEGIGDQVTGMAALFDPMATPAGSQAGEKDFLSWLGGWLGMTIERHWPEQKRRLLLKNAYRLYALRGTPEGLRLHIHLYTGVEPGVLEHYKLRRWFYVNEARLGESSEVWGNAIQARLKLDEYSQVGEFQLMDSGDPLHDPFYHEAHRFTVFVPLPDNQDQAQRQTLKRIVEMASPAHTQGDLNLVTPRFRVGMQSLVGLDTVIGAYPEAAQTGEGHLGYDTVLAHAPEEDQPPSLRIGKQARIGSTTVLD